MICLIGADKLDVKEKRRVGGNGRRNATGSIAELRRDDKAAPSADLHVGDAHVPAFDYGAGIERVPTPQCTSSEHVAIVGRMSQNHERREQVNAKLVSKTRTSHEWNKGKKGSNK